MPKKFPESLKKKVVHYYLSSPDITYEAAARKFDISISSARLWVKKHEDSHVSEPPEISQADENSQSPHLETTHPTNGANEVHLSPALHINGNAYFQNSTIQAVNNHHPKRI